MYPDFVKKQVAFNYGWDLLEVVLENHNFGIKVYDKHILDPKISLPYHDIPTDNWMFYFDYEEFTLVFSGVVDKKWNLLVVDQKKKTKQEISGVLSK